MKLCFLSSELTGLSLRGSFPRLGLGLTSFSMAAGPKYWDITVGHTELKACLRTTSVSLGNQVRVRVRIRVRQEDDSDSK